MSALSETQIKAYNENGYFFARELFSAEEIQLLRETATNDHAMDQAASLRDVDLLNETSLLTDAASMTESASFTDCSEVFE